MHVGYAEKLVESKRDELELYRRALTQELRKNSRCSAEQVRTYIDKINSLFREISDLKSSIDFTKSLVSIEITRNGETMSIPLSNIENHIKVLTDKLAYFSDMLDSLQLLYEEAGVQPQAQVVPVLEEMSSFISRTIEDVTLRKLEYLDILQKVELKE